MKPMNGKSVVDFIEYLKRVGKTSASETYFYLFKSYAEYLGTKLDELFNQLKNNNDVSLAFEIEMKIWNIWSTHPSQENLTQLLARGSNLMTEQKFNKAYEAFSKVISLDPNWAEGWNKRATVLYMLGRYQESQDDIDEVLKLEKRHFGALSGQGLVQIELKNYERAINSYKEVQKIYPSMMSPKIMIPQLKELIKSESI
jgi:tetratricopeptide (TPR) repeat protein